MAEVVGSRRDLIFVISELYYEVGGRHFVVGSKIAGCQHILTGLSSFFEAVFMIDLKSLGGPTVLSLSAGWMFSWRLLGIKHNEHFC